MNVLNVMEMRTSVRAYAPRAVGLAEAIVPPGTPRSAEHRITPARGSSRKRISSPAPMEISMLMIVGTAILGMIFWKREPQPKDMHRFTARQL